VTTETTPLAEAALALAAQGWWLHPLHSVRARADDDGRYACTCGNATCSTPGKHSALRGKRVHDNATNDIGTVRRWWTADPGRNIAAATGRVQNLLAVDFDAGSTAARRALESRHGPLPRTLTIRTGTGGELALFRHPSTGSYPSTAARIGERINTVGEGGYVILPPSLHASGEPYSWVDPDAPLADLPDWLVGLWSPEPTVEIGPLEIPDDEPLVRTPGIDAFGVCRGGATGDDVRGALSALAEALAAAEVDPDALRRRLREINDRRCRPPLTREAVDDLCFTAIAEDVRRRDEDRLAVERLPKIATAGTTAADQRILAARREREQRAASRDPARSALRAWIDTYWGVLDYDEPRAELRLVWLETGQVVEIPAIGTPADLEKRVIRYTGTLDLWARRAHPKATGKLAVALLKNLVAGAPARKREDAEGAPVQLVRTLLAASVWHAFTDERGETKRWKKSLLTVEGFYPDDGIGRVRVKGQELLVVHFAMLANGLLRSHPDFRSLNESRLKQLFLPAPGALPRPVRPRDARKHLDTDFWAIDLAEFRRATGENSGSADIVEIDSPVSPSAENSQDSSGETRESVGDDRFPQQSPDHPTPPQLPAPPGDVGERWGKGGGNTDGWADALFP